MKPSWGQIKFAPDTYSGHPPRKASINLDWGLTYAAAVHIFNGTVMLRKSSGRELVYDLFDPEYDVMLLEEGLDTEGNEVVLPLVIGSVNHMSPQRTGQLSEQKYYFPDFAGEIGSGINAYDDGVQINDSWQDNGDGTISRSVNIVGELTFSGSGQMASLVDLFDWACERLGLTLVSSLAEDVPLDCVISQQQYLIGFLDQAAWYADHGFYILGDVLYLISNDQDNGEQKVGFSDVDLDPVKISYKWPQPLKKYSAHWTTRKADTDSSGSRIITEDHDTEIFTDFDTVGIDESMPFVYNHDRSLIRSRMRSILNRSNMPEIEIELPLFRLPRYGERIDFEDDMSVNPARGYMRCRAYSLNYAQKTVIVHGDGEIYFK